MLLAGLLRLVDLDAGWFGVDQARDVTWAELIASGGAYPALGPLMRNRFHLGAAYYWFWALPAYLATGPLALYVYAGVLGTATVVLVWILTRTICGAPAALAAAALFASSPVAVIDARVAWAPAALPIWSALLLLAVTAFVRQPSTVRAALLLFLAALGTQLHLAAAPLALLAGGVVLWQRRCLAWRGLLLATVAGALPLLPMLAGLAEPLPVPTAAVTVPTATPGQHRLADILLLVPRLLVGLTPFDRPALVTGWLLVEGAAIAATLAAALYALLRPARATRPAALRLVALAVLAGVAAVALLPAEAWYYYLDATLVPAAVVLGAAWQSLRWRCYALWLLCGVVLGRTLVLAWWIHAAAGSGYVATNLDYLRLGGPRPAAPEARARLLDVRTKTAAAAILAGELAIPLDRLWRDVHGSGFADLDTDNGYFLRRASTARAAAGAPVDAAGSSAVLFHRGDFPAAWLGRMGPARDAGPLELRAYQPALDRDQAVLVGCGGGAPPVQEVPAPLAYGAGERAYPRWPCAEPRIEVPVRALAGDGSLRVFARVDGAARVLELGADPPGTPVVSAAPGAGSGIELAPGPARLFVRLAVDGPARLDLYELHGLR